MAARALRVRRTIVALSVFAVAGTAHAATFAVNSTADAVDATPGNGVCAAAGGACTLRAAVMEANALAGDDRIEIPAGDFVLAIAGADEDAAATGDLDLSDDVEIAGAGMDMTRLSGDGGDRVLDVRPSPGFLGITIRDVAIEGGRLVDAAGAGVRHADDGTLLVENTRLADNLVLGTNTSEGIGGAIASNGIGDLEVRSSRLADNAADRGGALFVNGSLTLLDSTLAANAARTGAALASYGNVAIERTTVADNASSAGCAVFVATDATFVRNATFSGNPGSCVFSVGPPATLTFEHATIHANPVADALSVGGVVAFSNSVIANPVVTSECTNGGAILSTGGNLDSDGSCVGAGPGDLPGTEPRLGPLADDGGPTATHAPLARSPLRDAADGMLCPAIDQRGVARPIDGDGDGTAACDIGAVEAPELTALASGVAAIAALTPLAARGSRSRRRS